MSGVVLDLPEEEYHRHPALSSSGAKLILESPARYRYAMDHPRSSKKAWDVGHAVHSRVLGVGVEIVEIPAGLLSSDGGIRSNEAKAWVAAAREAGQVPLKPDEYAPIHGMTEAVLAHPIARRVFERPGAAEASLFATDPATGAELRCRFDFLADAPTKGRTINGDLKTTLDASPDGFEATVRKWSYYLQEDFYGRVLSLARGDDDPAFLFVAVEKEPPYLVAVHELTDDHRRVGHLAVRRAIDTYAACLASGEWGGYGDDIHHTAPPSWWVARMEERYL